MNIRKLSFLLTQLALTACVLNAPVNDNKAAVNDSGKDKLLKELIDKIAKDPGSKEDKAKRLEEEIRKVRDAQPNPAIPDDRTRQLEKELAELKANQPAPLPSMPLVGPSTPPATPSAVVPTPGPLPTPIVIGVTATPVVTASPITSHFPPHTHASDHTDPDAHANPFFFGFN